MNAHQIFAFIIAIVALTASTYAALNGAETFAAIMAGSTIGGLTSAFLYNSHMNTKKQEQELIQETEDQ